jgi:O-antigen/teichoic acid export membrane protein
LNVISIFLSSVRAVGAILVLWKISPSITIFFLWQAFVTLIQTVVTGWYLWKQIAQTKHKPKFQRNLLSETRKFSIEMSGIALMAVAFTQLDKVVLSRVLTLEQFGYYYAASVAAGSIYIFISPIFSAIFPKFSQLVSQQEKRQIKVLYDQSSQLMAVTILPVLMVLMIFGYDLLFLWTQSKLTAENGEIVLGLLAIGNALNGLMNIPYALQLATGDAKSVIKINSSLIIISIPSIIFLASKWGSEGAAVAWVGYTLAFLIINTYIVHKKFTYLDNRSWMWNGVIKPATVAFMIVILCHMAQQMINTPLSQWARFMIVILTAAAAFFATAISSPEVITYIKNEYKFFENLTVFK